jgi:type III secretion protein K
MSVVAGTVGTTGLLRLMLQHNLHPETGVHPSWAPEDWPVRYRARLGRLRPAARGVLAEVLKRCGTVPVKADYHFDSRRKRLLLVDTPAVRRLAFYTSLCAHSPLLRLRRDALSAQIRRQARRFDKDAVEFVLDRAPEPTELKMSVNTLMAAPHSAGRVLMERGYRLVLAVLLPEGDAVVQRMQRKLHRRLAALPVPRLTPGQLQQLDELMLSCIVPERISQWDWLF